MTKKRGKEEDGMLLRGPDGNLYFISAVDLRKYKLSPQQKTCVERCLHESLIRCVKDCTVSASDSASASDSVLISSSPSARRRRAR